MIVVYVKVVLRLTTTDRATVVLSFAHRFDVSTSNSVLTTKTITLVLRDDLRAMLAVILRLVLRGRLTHSMWIELTVTSIPSQRTHLFGASRKKLS